MKTKTKTTAKPKISKSPKEKKLSKAGKAMRAGIGKDMFEEIGEDPWGLRK